MIFGGLGQTALDLISQYGYLALVVFMFLETSMLFPFVPSEIVLPTGAALLVDGPLSFALFVASVTVGATVGSLCNYYAFDVYGERALERYGRYIHVSESELDRGRRWFRRWGESSVLWGRLLPLVRSVISIPAGLAEMNVRRFTVYTAVGSMLFGAAIGSLPLLGTRLLPSTGRLLGVLGSLPALPVLVAAAVLLALMVVVGRRL